MPVTPDIYGGNVKTPPKGRPDHFPAGYSRMRSTSGNL